MHPERLGKPTNLSTTNLKYTKANIQDREAVNDDFETVTTLSLICTLIYIGYYAFTYMSVYHII